MLHRKRTLQRCVTHLKRNMFAKVRHGDKTALTADLRDIFRTGQRDYTIEMAWTKWQEMCDRWGKDYRAIKLLRNNADYKVYITYLNYVPEIQAMIYTTNRIEHLNRDFRRETRMRTAMPNEESVLTLIGSVEMDLKAFDRAIPNITIDKTLFPNRRKGFLSGMAILVKLKPPHKERLQYSTVSSLGATMLLAGCSSAEPVSSSGSTPKLQFLLRITK